MYNYFNDILNISYSSGSWLILKDGVEIGVSNIFFINNTYNISITIKRKGIVIKEINGVGNFTAENKMKFNLTTHCLKHIKMMEYEYHSITRQPVPKLVDQSIAQQIVSTLEIEILQNKFIKAKYYELEKNPELWNLHFTRTY